jgi:23S rRNA pseudouridine1911/1915/1917 synthase
MNEGQILVEKAGARLDLFLSQQVPDFSRSQWKADILAGRVWVNEASAKPNLRLKTSDKIVWEIPPPSDDTPRAESIPLEIIFEDEAVLVLNKPAGLVVHPGAGNESGTLVNALLFHDAVFKNLERAGIVHRLDKDTSGLLVVAKTMDAMEALQRQFKERETRKEYLALVWGRPPEKIRIENFIGRHPVRRQKMAVLKEGGKKAISTIEKVEQFAATALVQVGIETGRTHQIRVHLASIGHPVVGDSLYGRARHGSSAASAKRQMLHARKLEFHHPLSGKRLSFEAPLSDDMQQLLDQQRTEEHGGNNFP